MATGYHGFDEYSEGDKPWDYNAEFQTIDDLLWKIGNTANRPTSPPDGRIYLNTETRTIEQYDSGSGTWNSISSGVTDEQIQDTIGGILSSEFNYDDASNAISLAASGIANDKLTNDSITIAGTAVPLGGSINIDEAAQDAVGAMSDSTLAYSDSTPSFGVAASSVGLTHLATTFAMSSLITSPYDLSGGDIVDSGTTVWDTSESELVADIDSALASIDELVIPDTATNPSINGEIRQNGGDVLAYSGGAVRNLSNIGSSGGGAPTDASYITTATESSLSNETVVSSYPFGQADLDDEATGSYIVGAGDSLESAINTAGAGGSVEVTDGYDVSNDTLPIAVNHVIKITGKQGGSGSGSATIVNGTGSTLFEFNVGNQFSPGVVLRDLNIIQSAGGVAIDVQESKFGYFENVDVDGNGSQASTVPLWRFDDPDDTLVPNSQVLVECTAEQGGGDGFEFGNQAHHIAMFGCKAHDNGRMGVYVNGPYSFKFIGGQLEGNAEPGVRARQADSVLVSGNTYMEGNATTANLGNAEVVFTDSGNCVLEGPAWANAKTGGTAAVVRFDGVDTGEVRGIRTSTGDTYTNIAYITNSSDIDVHSASHTRQGGAGIANIVADAVRVRDKGIIVGAGSNNGGDGSLSGVDLGTVNGQFENDRAVALGVTETAYSRAQWNSDTSSWVITSGGSGSGTSFSQTTTTSDYTASSYDSVWVDASTSTVTVTLPSPTKSAEVRVLAIDAQNTISVSDNAGEGIQTQQGEVSSLDLQANELLTVESNGTTWEVIDRIENVLAAGTLGSLASTEDYHDFTVTNVVPDTETVIGSVAVAPVAGQSLSGVYPFHAEVTQKRDYTNGRTDLDIRVIWDTDSPPASIDVAYEVYEGAGGLNSGAIGSSTISIQDSGTGEGDVDTINFDNISVTVSGSTATVNAPSSGGFTEQPVVESVDSPLTASVDAYYPVDTTGGAVTINLPGTPADRDKIAVHRIDGGSDVTVDGQENNIEGSATDPITTTYTMKIYKYQTHTGEWTVTT